MTGPRRIWGPWRKGDGPDQNRFRARRPKPGTGTTSRIGGTPDQRHAAVHHEIRRFFDTVGIAPDIFPFLPFSCTFLHTLGRWGGFGAGSTGTI